MKSIAKPKELKPYQSEYKGAIIEPSIYKGFEWYHPDHVDADWTGDGWDTTGCGHENTIKECKEAIDDFLNELDEL